MLLSSFLLTAMVTLGNANGSKIEFGETRLGENKLIPDSQDKRKQANAMESLLAVVKQQEKMIFQMDKKMNMLVKTVNKQGTEITNMKETIQKQDNEIEQLKYERNRQDLHIKMMENELKKHIERQNELQTGDEQNILKTEINSNKKTEHELNLEDSEISNNMALIGIYFHGNTAKGNFEENTTRVGKTIIPNNDIKSFTPNEKSKGSIEKRMLSPIPTTRIAFSAYLCCESHGHWSHN